MNNAVKAVRDFHKKHGSHLDEPVKPAGKALQRSLYILKSLAEARHAQVRQVLVEALAEGNVEKFLDAYGDLLYVVFGTGATYGVTFTKELFYEIHRSNMSKPAKGDPRVQDKTGYIPVDLAKFTRILQNGDKTVT